MNSRTLWLNLAIAFVLVAIWIAELKSRLAAATEKASRQAVSLDLLAIDQLSYQLTQAGASNVVLRFDHGGRIGEIPFPITTNSTTRWLIQRTNIVDTSIPWMFLK